MKIGLAIMLVLGRHPENIPVDVSLVFYSGEEGPYEQNELGIVLDEDPELEKAHIACCLEPSDNHLHLGCAGSLHARVAFQGRTAHSARPWQGENAIHKAARVLDALGKLEPVEQLVDDLLWRNVLSATMASGGRARNIIPDQFELNLNSRFGPTTSVAEAKAALTELVGPDADVEFIDESPPALPFRNHPYVQALLESGVRGVAPKQAWTDVGRLAARGIVAVNLGPGVNSQAHQPNEWTDLPLLEEGLTIFREWLQRISAAGPDPC
jgi:succinyl-diaminopimelate desuccinylase